jgi:hypothetical protein
MEDCDYHPKLKQASKRHGRYTCEPHGKQKPDVVIKKQEEARNIHDTIQHSQALKIFTDGSGYQDHVESIMMVPDLNTCFMAYLGTELILAVYTAELKGMQMALAVVKRVVQAGASRWRERAARDT